MTDQPDNEVIEHKVRQAVARNALHKIGDIVSEEQRIDTVKRRYSSWIIRYGIVVLLLIGVVAARYWGVF